MQHGMSTVRLGALLLAVLLLAGTGCVKQAPEEPMPLPATIGEEAVYQPEDLFPEVPEWMHDPVEVLVHFLESPRYPEVSDEEWLRRGESWCHLISPVDDLEFKKRCVARIHEVYRARIYRQYADAFAEKAREAFLREQECGPPNPNFDFRPPCPESPFFPRLQ